MSVDVQIKSPKKSKKILRGIYLIVIIFALMATLLRSFTPLVAKYKSEIEYYLSNSLGSEIKIAKLQASWLGMRPVVQLNDVIVYADKDHKKLLSIDKLSIGINIWQSLSQRHFQPNLLFVDGAKFQIQKLKSSQYQIRGGDEINKVNSKFLTSDTKALEKILIWFINQDEVRVRNILVDFQSEKLNLKSHLVRLKILSNSSGHHIEGFMAFDNAHHTKARIIAHFTGERLKNFDGEYYVSTKKLDLKLLNEVTSFNKFKVSNGLLSFNLWGQIKAGLNLSGQADALINHLTLENIDNKQTKKVSILKGNIHFNLSKKKTSVLLNHLVIGDFFKNNKEYSLLFKREANKNIIEFSTINMGIIQSWFNFGEFSAIPFLNDYHLHGDLTNAQLTLVNKKPVLFFGEFKNLGWHNYSGFNLSHLNGQVYLDDKHGYLNIDSDNAYLSLPQPYQRAFNFIHLNGTYRWKKFNNFWRIASDRSYVEIDNISLSPKFSFDWYGSFLNSYLSLNANLSGKRIEELKPYLVRDLMSPKLYAWFQNAIISVPTIDGHVSFNGRLADFPFDNSPGKLQLDLYLNDAILKYHPKWPRAENLNARVVINNRALYADIKKAKLFNSNIDSVSVLIKPLGQHIQHLYLKGKSQLDSQNVLDFAMNSPLKEKLSLLSSMFFKGKLDLNLDLTIPLYPEDKKVKVDGNIQFLENTLDLSKSFKLTQLSGLLAFTESGILNSKLKANAFNYPLSLKLQNNSESELAVLANGKMGFNKIKQYFKDIKLNFLTGLFNYNLSIHFLNNTDSVIAKLKTDLKQSAIQLPKPFYKAIGIDKFLTVAAELSKHNISLDFSLDKVLSGKLKFDKDNAHYKLNHASFSLGNSKGQPKQNNHGIMVEGVVDELSVASWLDWYRENNLSFSGQNKSFQNLKVDLLIKKLKLYQYQVKDLNFQSENQIKGVLVELNSNMIEGKALIPYDFTNDELLIDLKHLKLQSSKDPKKTEDITPSNIPALNLKIEKFSFNNIKLGKLVLATKKIRDGLVIDKFVLQAQQYLVKLVGRWQQIDKQHLAEIEGFGQSSSLAELLKLFYIEPVVESKKALLTFKLQAKRSLLSVSPNNLNGNIFVELKNGRITHLSKDVESRLGLGKLISILSLQTLPRRLVLDFSDLSNKGFSFDLFKGNFRLNQGTFYTNDSYLEGPVAYVTMKGGVNVEHKLYDMLLEINPHITASLPIVATIAGGPIAGIATWVASKIINQEVNRVNSYTYKISGPWSHPVVQQVKISRAKK